VKWDTPRSKSRRLAYSTVREKPMKSKTILLLVMLLTISGLFDRSVRAGLDAKIVASRTVSVNVKLVFLGIGESDVDLQYMSWSENLPRTISTQVIIGGKDIGVTSNVKYRFSFAPSSFKERLLAYLGSIAETSTLNNPSFVYYEKPYGRWVQKYMDVGSTQYDANKVEMWLKQNSDGYGGTASDGWTLMFMYLPELPSANYETMKEYWKQDITIKTTDVHPHYYSVAAVDEDLGYSLRYRQFMTAYGNRDRFWFVDLSAGPSFWSWKQTIPLQVALKDQEIKLGSTYGRKWLTEYIADYAWGAVMNFIVPSATYYPSYTACYNFVVNLFDDRTDEERAKVPIEKTVNPSKIKEAFIDLVPYAKTDVQISFKKTEDFPVLRETIRNSAEKLDDAAFQDSINVIDVRPVYYFLQNNLASLISSIKKDEAEVTVPIFAFAFREKSLFSYSYKWDHSKSDPERPALLGISFEDMALVGLNQWYFTRGDEVGQKGKGLGFTQTIVHEAGHMIGLTHTHRYDDLGDFCYSAMGYFTNDYRFGQSDKDFIRRVHTDQLILKATASLQEARLKLESRVESVDLKVSIDSLSDELAMIESECDRLGYTEAVWKAFEAKQKSLNILLQSENLPEATVPLREQIQTLTRLLLVTVICGITTSLFVGFIVARRRYRTEMRRLKELSKVRPPPFTCSGCGTMLEIGEDYCPRCGRKKK